MTTSSFARAATDPSVAKFTTARTIIEEAHDRHGSGLILTSSFGAQSAVLLHLATRAVPDIPVVFADTGYLFPETYQYAQALKERLNLNLRVYTPLRTAAMQEAFDGRRWNGTQEQRQAYNWENKVEPVNRAVLELGATAWLSGLRRGQSERRGALDREEKTQGGIVKIYPLLDWNARDVFYYMKDNGLPQHPLKEKDDRYNSIGDWHSTFPDKQKDECGLHDASAAPRPEGDTLDYVI